MMKHARFPNVPDQKFQDETGISRGSLAPIERNESWPDIPTVYLWAKHCGSSLHEVFRAQSSEYSDDTRELHQKLEYLLRVAGIENNHVVGVINTYYDKLSPPPRAPGKRGHKPPSDAPSKKAGAVHVGS